MPDGSARDGKKVHTGNYASAQQDIYIMVKGKG
jgi:hypothetical protein